MSERSESEASTTSSAHIVWFALGTLLFALAAWWWDNAGGLNAVFLGLIGLGMGVVAGIIIRRGQL